MLLFFDVFGWLVRVNYSLLSIFFFNQHKTLCKFQKPPVILKNNRYLRKLQHCITHRFYNYFGAFVAMCNVIVISVSTITPQGLELWVKFHKTWRSLRPKCFTRSEFMSQNQNLNSSSFCFPHLKYFWISTKSVYFIALVTVGTQKEMLFFQCL